MTNITEQQHCETCAHLVTHAWKSWNGESGHNRYCNHPTGAKPMQINCAWHSDGAVMRIKSNRVFG